MSIGIPSSKAQQRPHIAHARGSPFEIALRPWRWSGTLPTNTRCQVAIDCAVVSSTLLGAAAAPGSPVPSNAFFASHPVPWEGGSHVVIHRATGRAWPPRIHLDRVVGGDCDHC